jgi:hypothetical protein
VPLPDEAQDASYFAAPARIVSFSPISGIKLLYNCIVIIARGIHFFVRKAVPFCFTMVEKKVMERSPLRSSSLGK